MVNFNKRSIFIGQIDLNWNIMLGGFFWIFTFACAWDFSFQ